MLSNLDELCISTIGKFLNYRDLIKFSKINKHFYNSLKEMRDKYLDKLPWRITAEYHFNDLNELILHYTKASVGFYSNYFDNESSCDFCSERRWKRIESTNLAVTSFNNEAITSNQIKTSIITGKGLNTIKKIILNVDHVPLIFDIDYCNGYLIPKYISYNQKLGDYYDEAKIEILSLDLKNRKEKCTLGESHLIKKKKEDGINYIGGKHVIYTGIDYQVLLDLNSDFSMESISFSDGDEEENNSEEDNYEIEDQNEFIY